MSLLDTGPETVTVYPTVSTEDPDGNMIRRPSADGVTTNAHVQPVTTYEYTVSGQRVIADYRVITRSAPAGPWARVVWRDRTWDVVGEPQIRDYSPTTRHVTFLIRAKE